MGKLAAFYYLKHETLHHFDQNITKDIPFSELLKVLAYASEFNEVPVRHNEDNLNEALAKICPLSSDRSRMGVPNEKAYLLL